MYTLHTHTHTHTHTHIHTIIQDSGCPALIFVDILELL